MISANGKKHDSARMRVRQYVMDLIFQESGKAVRLPSNEDLAKEIGIARSTVQLGVKSLIQEGYLETKRGIGTFTVPQAKFASSKAPLIALLDGDGKIFYQQYYSYSLRSYIGMELCSRSMAVQEVRLYSERGNDLFEELRSIRCDAFVCIAPPKSYYEILRRLSALRPVVVVDATIDGLISIELDRYEKGYVLGQVLLKAKRTCPLFSQGKRYFKTTFCGCQKAFSEAGIPLPDSLFFYNDQSLEKVEETLKNGFRPNAAVLSIETFEEIAGLLHRYHIDLNQECRLYTFMYIPPSVQEPVGLFEFPFQEFANQVAATVQRFLKNPDLPRQQQMFNWNYQFHEKQNKEKTP